MGHFFTRDAWEEGFFGRKDFFSGRNFWKKEFPVAQRFADGDEEISCSVCMEAAMECDRIAGLAKFLADKYSCCRPWIGSTDFHRPDIGSLSPSVMQ
jgi:hypothetical protein